MRRWWQVVAGAIVVGLSAPASGATAEPMDIDVDLAAKIAREKAKVKRDQQADSQPGNADANAADCGSVNIGNVSNDNNRIGAVPKTNTVVITGPVINMGNKCK